MLAGVTFFIRKGPFVLTRFDLLDVSWGIDLAFKSHRGVWLGRDVVFTYGPLFQWMLGFPSAWPHGWSMGAYFKNSRWLMYSYIIAATWVVAVLLLRGQPAWKRAFYVFGLVVFWMYWDVRLLNYVLMFSLCVYACDRATRPHTALAHSAMWLSPVLISSFLISADTGTYSLAAFVIVSLCFLYCYRSQPECARRIARWAMWVGVGLMLCGLLMGVLVTGSVSLEFWRADLATLGAYRWAMSSRMPEPVRQRFLLIGMVTLTIFVLGWIWRDARSRSLARHPAYLLSGMFFSLLVLESSVVRADWAHVCFGLFPGMMLAAAILMGADTESGGKLWQYLPVFAALGITAAFSAAPNPLFVPASLIQHIEAYRLPPLDHCPAGMNGWDDVCLVASDYARIHSVAIYLQEHTTRSDWVAVFPFENAYGVAANRKVAGGVLQSYAAAGTFLVSRQIAGLQAESPPLAIYSADNLAVYGIDFVPNLTRNPEIWLYLQSLYKTEAEIRPGVLILRRDPSRRQRWRMRTIELPILPQAKDASLRPTSLVGVADGISWPANADFLKLVVRVSYPMKWHVLKPSRVLVGLQFADGTWKNTIAIVEPNHTCSIWIYPWRDSALKDYFSPDESAWRTEGPRIPVKGVSIAPYRLDKFSVNPTSIKVNQLQAVELSLAQNEGQGQSVVH